MDGLNYRRRERSAAPYPGAALLQLPANETAAPAGMFVIEGHRIKAAGEHPGSGVYFVSAADAARRVKAAGRLVENRASGIIGIIPARTDTRAMCEGTHSLCVKARAGHVRFHTEPMCGITQRLCVRPRGGA
ncbi:MAG: DUF4469 domain-containing protein [Treponema sp.]|nr:DUF4469 domain-containing protein [Treponema sp.]